MKSPHADSADRRRDLIDILAIALLPRLVRRGAAESTADRVPADRVPVPPPVTAAPVTRRAQTPRSTPTPSQARIA
jgi:hypothetical protein